MFDNFETLLKAIVKVLQFLLFALITYSTWSCL